MIEIHTKMVCPKCGQTYHAIYVNTGALPKNIRINVFCPTCGTTQSYGYNFSADFECIPKWWQLWKAKSHYITDHFSSNEGNMNEEIYPRKCTCGKEILLKQKRVI